VTNTLEYAPVEVERSQGVRKVKTTGEKVHLKDFILEGILAPGNASRLTVKQITQKVLESDFSSRGGDVHSEVYVSQVLKSLYDKGLVGRDWDVGDRAYKYFALDR
jgi:hypothetical protein